MTHKTPKVSPCGELSASPLSRLLFLWSNQFVKQGYHESLSEEVIDDINPREKCENVVPGFEKHLAAAQGEGHKPSFENGSIQSVPETLSPQWGSSHTNVRHRKEKVSSSNGHIPASDKDTSTQKEQSQTYHVPKKRHSLWFVILRTFWKEFLLAQFCRCLFYVTVWISNPHLLSALIDHADNPDSSSITGVLLSLFLFVLLVSGALSFEHCFFNNQNLEHHIRSSLMRSVYKKALNLPSRTRKSYSIGELTNYMGSDADTIAFHLSHLVEVMFTPVHFIVVFYQLFHILGAAAAFGLAVIVIVMPVNVYVSVRMRALFDDISSCSDEKMKLLNEILTGIKVLKLHAWEKIFGAKLDEARNKELAILKRLFKTRAFSVFSWNALPYVISVVMFAGYFYLNEDVALTPRTAFAVVSLLNVLRYAINQTPEVIFDVIKASVSIKRLQKFLYEEEFQNLTSGDISSTDICIEMENATFTWDSTAILPPTLKNINLTVPCGALVGVVGQVGVGKSSLISAILGEIEKTRGHVGVQGNIAYVPQTAWIQNDTLQNNILFGKPMEKNFYRKVIEACALQQDIDILPAGDQTEIGERGINLSGGQKQRVSLARGVYNDADVYLLDDPLSAVDSHVGKHIFDELIGNKGMLKNKTRLLVTHNVRYLPDVDTIVVMDSGTVAESGSFKELLASDGVFTDVLRVYISENDDNTEAMEELESEEFTELDEETKAKLKRLDSQELHDHTSLSRQISRQSSNKSDKQMSRQLSTQSDTQLARHLSEEHTLLGKCTDEEDITLTSGKTQLGLFLDYSNSFGSWTMALIGTVYGLYYILWVLANIWLTYWTDDPLLKSHNDHTLHNISTEIKDALWRRNMYYLSVYSGLGVVMSTCILIYAVSMTFGVVRASRQLHHRLLMSILKSPMKFFDTTPIGRITNRFSRDIGLIDTELPFTVEFWFDSVANITVSMFTVIYSTPILIVLLIPLAYYYFMLQKYHTKVSSRMNKLESKARSPVESHFTESVMGTEVVRAFKEQNRFLHQLDMKVDHYTKINFYQLLAHRWLGVHMLAVGNLACAATALFRSLFKGRNAGALLGLSTTFTLEINGCMAWFIILQGEMETCLNSLDRVQLYIQTPNEADWRKGNTKLPVGWPSKGKVEFRNYSLRYREDLDLVLRNISFTVYGGEKIGVVGRTGAGKSSLMLALFRLVEPAEGTILIDGVDFTQLGLHDIREKLAIIPQDPVLFTGPLRMNLDPEDVYSDDDIWTALDHAHIRNVVESLPDKLQADCGEGGTNFSAGQRQLFCLARTLLRKSKVLVLDEATAAVDMETDDLIQQTIRSEFNTCTVLTIAHRLNTIMDYDRILVMDQGEVLELDTPKNLLQKKEHFYTMVQNAGLLSQASNNCLL